MNLLIYLKEIGANIVSKLRVDTVLLISNLTDNLSFRLIVDFMQQARTSHCERFLRLVTFRLDCPWPLLFRGKGENDYAIAKVKKFIYECGRTFGILQYDQERPLKAVCQCVCSKLGGLSLRAAPRNHPESHGSVGQSQRTWYGQLRAILYQVEHNTGLKIDSNRDAALGGGDGHSVGGKFFPSNVSRSSLLSGSRASSSWRVVPAGDLRGFPLRHERGDHQWRAFFLRPRNG